MRTLLTKKDGTQLNVWLQHRRTLILWGCYLLLALLLTWPTAPRFATHLPGDGGDDPAIAWNLWWVKHALLNLGQNPFHSDFMFYPIGINLAFYTLTTLNAVTAIPLLLNWGVVTASNLHLLFTFVVGGYGTFLLSRYILVTSQPPLPTLRLRSGQAWERGSRASHGGEGLFSRATLIWLSAAIAGGFYAFASSKLFYVALGQFNIASSHWIPFTVLYVLKAQRRPHRLKNALMAGLFLTLQTWAEMTYATFLLIFIALFWLYQIIAAQKPFQRQTITHHLKSAVVIGLTFTVGILPILTQMLPDMLAEGDFLVEGGGFAGSFSADLFGFLIPTQLHPLLGNLIAQTNISNFDKGQHIYIGYVFLGLLIFAFLPRFRHPSLRFWFIATFIFAALTLGPMITVNGHATGIPGPFVIFQNFPFFKGNRYPSRYSVMLILSLSVIASFGLLRLGRLTKRPWPLALIAALFLFEHLAIPLPQSDMRAPAAYQRIAADPDEATVLDIPFAWRNGFRITGAFTTQFMFGQFYQTAHQKRLLQGNTSRNPEFKFQYFSDAPLLNSLLALETGKPLPPDRWDADRRIAAETLRFFNIKYIVVRPETDNPFGHYPQNTIPYIEDVLPVTKIYNEPAIKIYRVKDTVFETPSELLIEPGTPTASLYFGEGWGVASPGQFISAQRKTARLLLPLDPVAQRLTLQAQLPEMVSAKTRSVQLKINGWESALQQLTRDEQEIRFDIPAEAIEPGLNNVWIQFDDVTQLPQLPAIDLTAISAGEEVGDFGHIFVNGYDISPNQRGYNVAIIPPDLRPPDIATFDTNADPNASTALINFLNSAPPGARLVIAAADEASANLSKEAVQSIQAITGASGDLRGCFRCSHAIIHEPGGLTLEQLDPLRPAAITTNMGLTEPNIAAVVHWVRVEPRRE